MGASVQTDRDRLRASIEALSALLRLAEHLRRTNAAKWEATEAEWQAAVRGVTVAPAPYSDDPTSVSQAILAAQSAGRRLGNSGQARFASASVGRHPDSSQAGERFYGDMDAVRDRVAELRTLMQAEQKVAPDCRGKS